MNGTNQSPPTTSIRIIGIVVTSLAVNLTLGLLTLAICMIFGVKPEGALLTAFVGVTGQLSGALTGLLVNTRSQPQPTSEPEQPQPNPPQNQP